MQPTIFTAVIVALIGVILISRDKVKASWWFFAFCQLFGGTSAAALTALGGSSLLISQAGAIVLMLVAFLGVGLSDPEAFRRSVITHRVALAIIAYTVIISTFGPRLFEGKIDVFNMRPDMVDGVPVATPLRPRVTNITQPVYLSATFLCAIAISIVFARRLSDSTFTNSMVVVGICHATTGLIDWLGGAVGLSHIFEIFRNANFAMLDQTIGQVRRLSGTLPEPSAYAGVAVPFAIYATEYWLRTRKAAAGFAGAFLWVMTLASTSSGGIFATLVYFLVLGPRFLLAPIGLRPKLAVGGLLVVFLLVCVGISLAFPAVYVASRDFVMLLTVQKGESESAYVRGIMAQQGWTTFINSFGLGTGAGSFRSSSLPMAILGSLGVIGCVTMIAYLLQIVVAMVARHGSAAQKAAAWTAVFALVPAAVAGPAPDPGLIFGLFAGFALHPRMAPVPELQRQEFRRSVEPDSRPRAMAQAEGRAIPMRNLRQARQGILSPPPNRNGSES